MCAGHSGVRDGEAVEDVLRKEGTVLRDIRELDLGVRQVALDQRQDRQLVEAEDERDAVVSRRRLVLAVDRERRCVRTRGARPGQREDEGQRREERPGG
jgi:hypothetical protein